MITRVLLSTAIAFIPFSTLAEADSEKMPPTIKCGAFLEGFSRAAKDFSPHRTDISASPQKGSSIGMQISNWHELQAAYDCKDGMFIGISATLLDNSLEGKGSFRRFFLSVATAVAQHKAGITDLEEKALKEGFSETNAGNYVIYLSYGRHQRFSVDLRYK